MLSELLFGYFFPEENISAFKYDASLSQSYQ